MKIEFESLVEFHAMAEAMGYVKASTSATPTVATPPKKKAAAPTKEAPTKEAPKKEEPKKEEPKKEEPKKEEPKKEEPKKEEPKKEETPEATIDDVVALATEMIGDVEKPERRNAVVEMVQAMGVSRVTLIPAEKVAEAMAMIEGK